RAHSITAKVCRGRITDIELHLSLGARSGPVSAWYAEDADDEIVAGDTLAQDEVLDELTRIYGVTSRMDAGQQAAQRSALVTLLSDLGQYIADQGLLDDRPQQ